MKEKVSLKKLIISSIAALICGVFFNAVIPISAVFVFDILFTFAAFLDPLHAGAKINDLWGALVGIVIIQTSLSILASIAVGISVSFFTEKVKTGWIYFIGPAVSLGIYCFFQFISIISVGVFAGELAAISWLFISMVFVGLFSIFIGLILVVINQKLGS